MQAIGTASTHSNVHEQGRAEPSRRPIGRAVQRAIDHYLESLGVVSITDQRASAVSFSSRTAAPPACTVLLHVVLGTSHARRWSAGRTVYIYSVLDQRL